MGLDPGSRITGYGVIESNGNSTRYLSSGCIRLGKTDLPDRLQHIYQDVGAIIAEYKPDEFAIEQVFMARNAASALTLGQARGAAIVAASSAGLKVAEYSARQIKQAVVGKGGAQKHQVQHMVQFLLSLSEPPPEDAADALAAALCHAHGRQLAAVSDSLASNDGAATNKPQRRRQRRRLTRPPVMKL